MKLSCAAVDNVLHMTAGAAAVRLLLPSSAVHMVHASHHSAALGMQPGLRRYLTKLTSSWSAPSHAQQSTGCVVSRAQDYW